MNADWQPIETAPIEVPILVVANEVVQNVLAQKFEDGTWADTYIEEPLEDFEPSHWMLLPKPPKF